jgi:hypothetical protein
MIDSRGVSDACYHPFVDGLAVGVAATFAPGEGIVDMEHAFLRQNPQLLQNRRERGVRMYHPARMTTDGTVQVFSFVRWFDWQLATNLQVVLRWEKRSARATCARFGEESTFGFDILRERDQELRHRYTNLDFQSITPRFTSTYIRSGNNPRQFRYFRMEGDIFPGGVPAIVITEVERRLVPEYLVTALNQVQ